jgi:heme-degrading monooxygenase HmoA
VILRVLTATVRTERAGTFNDLMRQQLPLLREAPGLVWVKLARRIQGATEEVILVEEWRDTASLYGWTGPEITKPRLMPGAEALVTDLRIAHYEALDIEPDEG